ncbi:hypothetical protein SFC07_11760 [Corynebacterium callunae]|uniref:hypothetical protein n=1 Tax=Corynebacterium callunae TaxID=1721 RepID=UPI0039828828
MSSISKKFMASATAAVAALALAACTPPHQQDSDQKVATATGVEAPTSHATASTVAVAANAPGYIDCVGAPEQQPATISLNCLDNSEQLTEIKWEAWGTTSATGTATRVVTSATGEKTETADVDVELSFPTESSQGLVFAQVSVDGEVITL